MLTVKTPAETLDIITDQFHCLATQELVPLEAALGRVLAEDILAQEFGAGFRPLLSRWLRCALCRYLWLQHRHTGDLSPAGRSRDGRIRTGIGGQPAASMCRPAGRSQPELMRW